MELAPDFKEFIELLNSHSVRYMIVGGFAVAHHGYPRPTGDIDFFVDVSEVNASRIVEVLNAFGFGGVGVAVEDFTKSDHIVQLGYPPVRIDVATTLSGISFDEAWAERSAGTLDGVPVSYISKRHLLANKAVAGRAKDKADLERLTERQS